MESFLTALYGSKQTVFTSREIALLIGEKNKNNLKSKLSYYVKTEKLIRLRRGIFAKNRQYDSNELAVRIFTPAYISFETVLGREGVTFQYYSTLFVASYLTREILVDGNTIAYRKLKDIVLANPEGLINRGYYFEATKERALLDRLYLFGDYSFDNLRSVDWDACRALVPLYQSQKLEKTFARYEQEYCLSSRQSVSN